MLIKNEELLSWLQNFYAYKIKNKISIGNIKDDEIDKYNPFNHIPPEGYMIKIDTLDNPGWTMEFYSVAQDNLSWEEKLINLEIEESDDWFLCILKETLQASSGPLYLSACLEALRCFVEGKKFEVTDLISFRENIKKENSLLCWLEEFYFSCCDTDWEHSYGNSFVSVKEGWLVSLSVEELYYEDSDFERIIIEEKGGKVECYKKDSQFIIRAHYRGLITGLEIFKNWIESHPDYEEKRKDIY